MILGSMEKELKDQRVTIMLTASELKELDDWSFSKRIRSRGAAMRELLSLGLAADELFNKVRDSFADGEKMSFDDIHDAVVDAQFRPIEGFSPKSD